MTTNRMGQYASWSASEMLEQARRRFTIHADAVLYDMGKRIRHESVGNCGVGDLKG